MTGDSSPCMGREFFSLSLRSDRFWGPQSLLSNGLQRLFPWGQSGRGVKLTTHFHLIPTSRMRGAIPPLPQYAFMAWYSVKEEGQFYLYLYIKETSQWMSYVTSAECFLPSSLTFPVHILISHFLILFTAHYKGWYCNAYILHEKVTQSDSLF
jgi:hypothetical protein